MAQRREPGVLVLAKELLRVGGWEKQVAKKTINITDSYTVAYWSFDEGQGYDICILPYELVINATKKK